MPLSTGFVVKNGSKTRAHGRAHAEAGVGDREANVAAGLDVELARLRGAERAVARRDRELAAGRHRVARVDDEVGQQLLELAGVGLDRAEPGREHRRHRDVLADEPRQHRLDVGDDRVERERLGLPLRFAAEREQLAREARGARGGLRDLADIVGDRMRGPEILAREVGVGADHGEDVVEVMRDAAGELADRVHLLRLSQLIFELARLRHVDGDADHREPAVELDRVRADVDVEDSAVFAAVSTQAEMARAAGSSSRAAALALRRARRETADR